MEGYASDPTHRLRDGERTIEYHYQGLVVYLSQKEAAPLELSEYIFVGTLAIVIINAMLHSDWRSERIKK